MTEQRNKSYHQIVRSTGMFGGAQVANILIGIVRNKLVAILLGTAGTGLISIYQSTVDLIKSISSLGIETTGVREIAAASENKDDLILTTSVISRWALILASLGAIICLILCYPISIWAFESPSYAPQIAWLSICLFFTILAAGEAVILQGMRKISYMIKSGLIWNISGLVISIPLYYFFNTKAIIPAFIVVSIAMYLSSYYYRRKIDIQISPIPFKVILKKGKFVLRIGFFIVLAAIQTQATLFIVKAWVINRLGMEQLGLLQAAWTITNVYLMLILKSMGADFYPRLSSITHSNTKMRKLVNEQVHIILIVSVPIIILLLLSSKILLSLLYSSSFEGASTLLNWRTLGIFFKVISWALGFVFLAKGKGLVFFITDTSFSIIYLITIYALFPYCSLDAVGIGYMVAYISYLFIVYVLSRKLCNFRWRKNNISTGVVCLTLIIATFYIAQYNQDYILPIGIPILIGSSFYSLYKLNKVFALKSIFGIFKDK